jgi:hypothetical protein
MTQRRSALRQSTAMEQASVPAWEQAARKLTLWLN